MRPLGSSVSTPLCGNCITTITCTTSFSFIAHHHLSSAVVDGDVDWQQPLLPQYFFYFIFYFTFLLRFHHLLHYHHHHHYLLLSIFAIVLITYYIFIDSSSRGIGGIAFDLQQH
ncbi:hypothetical protein TYRP_013019 [Tyrophagus putrescentiae]|nr:hypothetical protein TYRP_013019 [Tyrophagus putrescentiae]